MFEKGDNIIRVYRMKPIDQNMEKVLCDELEKFKQNPPTSNVERNEKAVNLRNALRIVIEARSDAIDQAIPDEEYQWMKQECHFLGWSHSVVILPDPALDKLIMEAWTALTN